MNSPTGFVRQAPVNKGLLDLASPRPDRAGGGNKDVREVLAFAAYLPNDLFLGLRLFGGLAS